MHSVPKTDRRDLSKSGIMPRPVFEPDVKREPPAPHMPDFQDHSNLSDVLPDIQEGHDTSAVGDADYINGN
ncbi:MAG TPA: hypothetical protein PKX07_06570 [Aggregatilineales bacterium]|nr:hypothetical protein [Aggregatilineales bacterium]